LNLNLKLELKLKIRNLKINLLALLLHRPGFLATSIS